MAKTKKDEPVVEEEAPTGDGGWDTTPAALTPELEEAGWGESAKAAVPQTLNIEQHQGAFDPEQPKILVYGESGANKTRFASTFPSVLFVDVDHGMNSVTEKVAKVKIQDTKDGLEEMRAVWAFLKEGNHTHRTVVLDTLNEMQRVIMRFTIEEFTQVKRSYGKLPGMSDYGYMLNQFMALARDFLALPMRVVFIAQVNSQQFDTDTLMPQLIGKNTAREIARKMDVIGYIFKSDEEGEDGHKIPYVSFDDSQHVTKDRSGKLPSILKATHYTNLAAFWE